MVVRVIMVIRADKNISEISDVIKVHKNLDDQVMKIISNNNLEIL